MTIPETMHAAVMTEYGRIEWLEVPVPKIGENEVLVKVQVANICGSDMHIYHGKFHPRTSTPLIMGHEFTGTVVAKGARVEDVNLGERVAPNPIFWCGECPACKLGRYSACSTLKLIGIDVDGAFGEYVAVKDFMLYKLPPEITDEDASLIEIYAVAFHACNRAQLKPGDMTAIWSAGRVGHCLLQVVRTITDQPVFIVDIVQSRLELAKQFDPNVTTINALEEDPVEVIKKLTDGRGVDVAFEAGGPPKALPGRPHAIMECVHSIRGGGTVCLVGIAGEPVPITLKEIIWKEVQMMATRVYVGEFADAIREMSRGNLRPDLLMTKVLPMRDIVEAFDLLETQPDKYLKVGLRNT